jgi:hypothetical protein
MTNENFNEIRQCIANQHYNEAIEKLEKMISEQPDNQQAKDLLEYVQRILNYMHRDIFAATNLDLDPWEE